MRETCWRCRKPTSLCVCADIPEVHNHTGIIVLQHRKERNHPLGTARFVRLGLARQEQHVLLSQEGASEAVPLPPGAALLYPSADAVDLATLPPAEHPTHLVLLDATWPLAHQLHRDNAWIRALPHVALEPAAPSRYRIRSEPQRDYVSTLEAAVAALRILEPDLEGLEGLLTAFDGMIDAQLAANEPSAHPRTKRRRQRASRAVPRALKLSSELVLACIESGPRPAEGSAAPLHWAALRLSDGATFERIAQVEEPVSDGFLRRLELEEPALEKAVALPEVQAAFADFCGHSTVVAGWSRSTCEHAAGAVGASRTLRVKPVWTNARRTRRVSHLEHIVDELGLDVEGLGVRGRAGRRLAATAAMVRHLVEAESGGT